MSEKGGISVETRHIFPIIKRWLYSDKEIFLRELVSNSSDAITKIQRLVSLGEVRSESLEGYDDLKITVELDAEGGTVSISDNGIGMNAEEIKKYINQIALSGALEFIEKYETDENQKKESKTLKEDTTKNGIIGHFGLGFYSSFMVADRVDIRTKSFAGGSGVHWTCNDGGDFELFEGDCELSAEKADRGTEVILYINDENKEFLSAYKLKEILEKYCAFMPVPIYFIEKGKEHTHKDGEECPHHSEHHPDGEECDHSHEDCDCNKPINETEPLWTKNPSSCKHEEYTAFYKKLFHDFKDPLFYIHINADYPLNFKGILYFPKLNHQFDSLEGEVKLYYNQVFVADNIKEVVPEYLLMLKGVLDCPELPLNVSRSYLQNSGYVGKISSHIIKKVGDKLISLFTNDRENYEGFWADIKTFIEYGCIRDRKFFDRIKDTIIYKTTKGTYRTISEYIAKSPTQDTAKSPTQDTAKSPAQDIEKSPAQDTETVNVYYTTNANTQAVYINMYERAGNEVIILDNVIETQFISMVEMESNSGAGSKANSKENKDDRKPAVKFVRVDSDIDAKTNEGDGEKYKGITELFRAASGRDGKFKIEAKEFADGKVPLLLTLSEQSRRIADMMKQYRMYDQNLPDAPEYEETLAVNAKNPLIIKLMENPENERNAAVAKQLYTIALLGKRELTAAELAAFVESSTTLYADYMK